MWCYLTQFLPNSIFYKQPLILGLKFFSSNNSKCWSVCVSVWNGGAHPIFNNTANPKPFLFGSRFVAVLLLYNNKSLISSLWGGENGKSHGVTKAKSETGWLVELLIVPQDGAGRFTVSGPWKFLACCLKILRFVLPPAILLPSWRTERVYTELCWLTAKGCASELALYPGWKISFLVYVILRTSLVVICSCASQDDFTAGWHSFSPTAMKPPRLILFSKPPVAHSNVESWQNNLCGISDGLFCSKGRKILTSRNYIKSFYSIFVQFLF